MTLTHAWEADADFAAAIRDRLAERAEFFDEVVQPWIDAHPNNHPYGSNGNATSFDLRIDGFYDGARKETPPEGLSRAQARSYLKPVRQKAGDPWREVLARLNGGPSLDAVFKDYGVSIYTLTDHRLVRFNLHNYDTGVFLTASADIPGEKGTEHLTPIKLSVFYAAKEAQSA